MKTILIILFTGVFLTFAGCEAPHTKPLDQTSKQLSDQFCKQWDAKEVATPRKFLSAHITGFQTSSVTSQPSIGIAVVWDNATTYTSVPLVQLGDGLFGITLTDQTSKEDLSAVISFR